MDTPSREERVNEVIAVYLAEVDGQEKGMRLD